MTDVKNKKGTLPMADVFWAMVAIDGSREYLVGRDAWRTDITNADGGKIDTLEDFDSELTNEVLRQPKTKGGKWSNPKEWNLWTAVHNGLLLPILGQVLESYSNTDTKLTYKEAQDFFSPLAYIVNHCKEYQACAAEYHYEGKEPDQIKKEWTDRLEGYFKGVDMKAPLPEIIKHLPDNLRRKVETFLKHPADPRSENDSMVGRMICGFLATKGNPWKKLGMEPRIVNYLKPLPDAPADFPVKTLYTRLLEAHTESVPRLMKDIPVAGYTADAKIPMGDFFKLYRWYGTGTVVETVKPDLVGAGHLGFAELSAFCKLMETKYRLNHHDNALMADNIKLFKSTQSLQKMGRLSLIHDIIEYLYEGKPGDGKPLRDLALKIWSVDERETAWSHALRYVPESRSSLRDFSTFKHDIGGIIYSAGLFEERRGHRQRAAALKELAFKTKKSRDSLQSLGEIIRDKAAVINDWVAHWEEEYPDSERIRIARFVQQTFGLVPAKLVPVKLDEIMLGLKGSGYKADKHIYHLKYREVKDTVEMDIPLPASTPKGTVRYNTATEDGIPVLEIKRSDGKQIRISVPARGAYDPYGRTGSAHGGEIIGFGCSVHHTTLALVLAELAALGADHAALQSVKDKFMRINPGMHLRKTLADFQVEQVWAAFSEGKTLTQAEYLQKNPDIKDELLLQVGHEHTAEYLSHPDREPLAASATRAWLGFGYGELYPHKPEDIAKIGARDSWYVVSVDARLAA